jgi:tol-pal system protein YbgF
MPKPTNLRKRILIVALLAMALATAPGPAHAASKEIIELQTQVQQLLDQMQRLQSTMDNKFGVLQHLVEQTADNTNQMSVAVNALQQKINAQSEAGSGKLDTVSGQVQSLNDSVDELKSRIAKLDKSIQDLQTQLQNIQSPPAGAAPGGAPGAAPDVTAPTNGSPSAETPAAAAPQMGSQMANQAPPLAETFQAGVRDYNAARYDVAAGEFQDVIHYYPLDDLAGQAQFYLGEIAYRQLNFADAVKAFNAVLESFPGSPKAPAAQLRKGFALLQLNKKEAGYNELRLLIKRHPQTPEAAEARSKLNSMGVRITPPVPR